MSDFGTFHQLGELQIAGLTGKRAVKVFLPKAPGPHPVIYMFDGQNLFDDAGSYSGGWHVHEVMARLAERKRPTAAVVAIDHGGEYRIGDYAPVASEKYGEGRADLTLDFIINVLKPKVDREYPVRTERKATFLGGSSMGALISLYGLLRHPETFGGALAMSPSLWFGGGALMKLAQKKMVLPDARVYLSIGEKEMGPFGLFLVEGLRDSLKQRGLDRRRLRLRIDPRGRHNEADWRRKLPLALLFLLRECSSRRR